MFGDVGPRGVSCIEVAKASVESVLGAVWAFSGMSLSVVVRWDGGNLRAELPSAAGVAERESGGSGKKSDEKPGGWCWFFFFALWPPRLLV